MEKERIEAMEKYKVKQNEENPEPTEVIAEAIIKVADAMEKMKATKLTERAILLLIRDSISGNIGLGDIKTVLNAAADLKKNYIKSVKPVVKK